MTREAAARWLGLPFGILRDPTLAPRGRWILYSALTGTVAGVGAILFDLAFRLAQRLLLEGIGGFRPPGSGFEGAGGSGPQHVWLLPLSLVVGGLLSGALVFGLAPEAEGHGTDAVIKSFHHLRGRIRKRVPAVKAIASAITIGSGGSAGREGPIAQIGAGFGSFAADLLKLGNADRRILMMAGVAGGVGSIFRAPLGAALFASEVLYSEPEFETRVLIPGLISAITGFSIYSTYAGWGLLFNVPALTFQEPSQLVAFILLGVACAVTGAVYPAILYGVRDHVFRPMRLPAWSKPAVGALVVGGIGMLFPPALGMGYGYIQEAIDGKRTIAFLLTFAAVKIVATSFTISSGGSGGVFGPSLVIGGAIGGAFGTAFQVLAPSIAPDPAACIMVGMGGFFAGVAKVPFASVIMVMEMTGSYGLLVPSLLVAAVAYLALPPGIRLYENQVPNRSDSPAHMGSLAIDVLRGVRVRDVWTKEAAPCVIAPGARLADLMEVVSESGANMLPVVDDGGRLLGELSIEDIRRALLAEVPRDFVVAVDIMRPTTAVLRLDDDLASAARLLSLAGNDEIFVVEGDGPAVRGSFGRRDLILAYGKELARLREDGDVSSSPVIVPSQTSLSSGRSDLG